jgi:hypothetical protein
MIVHDRIGKVKYFMKRKYVGKMGKTISFHGLLLEKTKFRAEWNPMESIITYRFEDLDRNIIRWSTTKNLNLIIGERYPITGVVKDFDIDERNKQPITVITNGNLDVM